MPLIPSESLSATLERSRVGVWIEELYDGRVALATKVPTNIVKAVHRGATCSLLVAVVEVEQDQMLCLGLGIQDEIENPFTVSIPYVAPKNQQLVERLLACPSTTIYFFNELSHQALEAGCSLLPSAATQALNQMKPMTPFSLTQSGGTIKPVEIVPKVELGLDLFQKHTYRQLDSPTYALMYQVIPLTMSVRASIPIVEVTPTTQSTELNVDDNDEGGQFEQSLYLPLEATYPGYTFLSPKIQEGNSQRELTDLLSFDPVSEHICVVQSKAMSVQGNLSKPSARRASSVNNQIQKALAQLCGTVKRIRDGYHIYDGQGETIVLPDRQTSFIHAIALVSEMYYFVDWRRIARQLAGISDQERYRALFHVLDFQEITYLASLSSRIPGSRTRYVQCLPFATLV